MSALRGRLRRWLPFGVALALGFLCAFAIVAWLVFPSDTQIREVRVPSVVGLPALDAERRLKALGLKSALGETRFAADAPKNSVIAQSPQAGQTVNAGTAIVLDISGGQEGATVPALIGATREDAQNLLERSGLAIGGYTESPSDSARGMVLASDPAAGAHVATGTRVSLTISAGPNELSIPDVVGRDVTSARGTLEQLGLVVVVDMDSLSALSSGTVVAQTPSAGSAIAGGGTVTLRVAGRL